MRESDNVIPQKFFTNQTATTQLTTATFDMALVASANSLYQVDSTGGSTVWGVGTGGGGAADGLNIVSMATSTSGGGTGGTTYSQSTGTVGLYAGSNVTLSQSNNAIVIFGPSPAAASLAISAGSTSSSNTGITFAQSNNVGLSYNGTQVWGNAWVNVSASGGQANVSKVTFSNSNNVTFGITTNTQFSAVITASIPQHSLSFSDNSLVTFSQSTNGSSTTIYVGSLAGGGGAGGAITVSAGTTSNTSVAGLVFSNSNQVSFGLYSSSRITASIPQFSLVFDTAGASGNISFSTSSAGSTTTVYATGAGGGGTGGADGFNIISMGAGTSLSGTTLGARTSWSTGTVGLFAGSNMYLSQTSNSIIFIAPGHQIGAGSQTNSTTGPINFVNSNSITFGMSGSSQITASQYGHLLSFSNANGVTFGTSSSTNATGGSTTVTASVGAGGGVGTVGFSAAGGSSAFTTLSFRDLNGAAWTNSGGQVALNALSLSGYATGNTTQSSTGTFGHNSLLFRGGGDISVGVSNNSIVVSGPPQTNQSLGIYGSSQTTGASSSSTYDARSLTIVGQGANSVGWTNGSLVISAPNTIAQTNQSLGIYGSSQTTGASSSSTYDARSLTIVGQGANSVGWTNGSLIISAPNTIAQTNQSLGIYGSSQTTGQSSSSTYDARSLSIVGRGAVSVGWSNSSLLLSAPDTIAQSVQTQSNVQGIIVSDTTYRTGDVSFSNLNGISFGSNGANVVTASYTVPTQSNQTGEIYITAQSTGQSSRSTYDLRTLSIVGDGIVSAGWSNSTLRISATQSNQAYNIGGANASFQTLSFGDTRGVTWTADNGSVAIATIKNSLFLSGANTFSNTTGTWNHNSFVVSGAGVASVGLSGQTLIVSAAAAAGDGVNVIQMFTSTTGGLTSGASTSWSTGTFGLQAGSGILLSQTSNSIVVQGLPNSLAFANSNNATFGTSTAGSTTTVTVSAPVNFSAGTTSNNLTNVVFSNSQNVVWGINGSTVTAGLQYISSYENCVPLASARTQTVNGASVSAAVAFFLPQPGSFSFLRIPCEQTSGSAVTLTTAAASMSGSAQRYSTWNAVVYSLGTGASSKSLISVASGSCGETILNSISVAANGSEGSYTLAHTYPLEGNTTNNLSTQYSITGTVYSFTSNQIASRFTGSRMLDIPFANSLSAGPYWLIFGYSSSSASNSARVSNATSNWAGYSNHLGASQPNAYYIPMGNAGTSGDGLLGAGSFSTAGGGTTSILPIANISSSASNLRPYFQLLRSA